MVHTIMQNNTKQLLKSMQPMPKSVCCSDR